MSSVHQQRIRVVVHRRHRFFREGLAGLLAHEPGVEVTGLAATADDVRDQVDGADVLLLDFVDDVVAAMQLSVEVSRDWPDVRSVAMCATDEDAGRIRESGVPAVVPSARGVAAVTDAIHFAGAERTKPVAPRWSSPVDEALRQVLTKREREVLMLIGAGCTTWETSQRLGISRKTVENHKQRIFTKLGVQNQAHAVSVAVRRRLIRVEGVAGLAMDA
jgi:DNA-binding NarL/FixJ family response regulator